MKKLFISLALLTAVAAVHAAKTPNEHRKQARTFLRKNASSVGNLPISKRAKVEEHEQLVKKGKDIHRAMATSDDQSHEERMSKVEKHVGEHAEAAQTLKRSASTGSLPGRSSEHTIQSQD